MKLWTQGRRTVVWELGSQAYGILQPPAHITDLIGMPEPTNTLLDPLRKTRERASGCTYPPHRGREHLYPTETCHLRNILNAPTDRRNMNLKIDRQTDR